MEKTKIHKHNDALHQIAKASEAIRRKHKMIKLNRDTTEDAMSEMFQPVVTPLQQLVATSKQQMKKEIKSEPADISIKKEKSDGDDYSDDDKDDDDLDDDDNDDHKDDDDEDEDEENTLVSDDVPATSTPVKKKDPVSQYLRMFDTQKRKDLDLTYGVRKLKQRMMIGDSQIHFENNMIYVGNHSYESTPGLLELLFKKSPDPMVVDDRDKKNYSKIVTTTNAHRKYYQPDQSFRMNTSAKYKKFIARLVASPSPKKKKTGTAVPDYKIARKEGQQIDYVHWDDKKKRERKREKFRDLR